MLLFRQFRVFTRYRTKRYTAKKLLVNDKITALRWQTNMYFKNYVKCSKHQKKTLKNF